MKKQAKAACIILLFASAVLLTGCVKEKQMQAGGAGESSVKKETYYCPMHPQVISDRPGACPVCHMDLVRKAEEGKAEADSTTGLINISRRGQVLANLSTVKVKSENIVKEINAFGYLDFAEDRRRLITARFSGRIEKLFAGTTGMVIKKGDPLFEIYSPDLIQAQNDYLVAIRTNSQAENILLSKDLKENSRQLQISARKKIEIYGLTEQQIKDLESGGGINPVLVYYSPYAGTVIEKKIQEGAYITEGAVIYEVADLSVLWNITEVSSEEISTVKKGDRAALHISSFPGKEFSARVTFISPVISADTRTVKIRSEVQNQQLLLRPQMYTQTLFRGNLGEGIAVPENAVLFTGRRNIVWVKSGEDRFEPRNVILGVKAGGRYQVLGGLAAGEEIAGSGNFLIDSESQLSGLNEAVKGSGPEIVTVKQTGNQKRSN